MNAESTQQEFVFSSLEHYFDNQRVFMSAYSNLIKEAILRVCASRSDHNTWMWTDSDAIINAVGTLPELYVQGEKLLFDMMEHQQPLWCKHVAMTLADKLMASCRTFARCHELHKLTVWTHHITLSTNWQQNMYDYIEDHAQFYDELTSELLTCFQQSLCMLDCVLKSSFVSWVVISPSDAVLFTCTNEEFRRMQVAFAMIENTRTAEHAPVVLGADIVRLIFQKVASDNSMKSLYSTSAAYSGRGLLDSPLDEA